MGPRMFIRGNAATNTKLPVLNGFNGAADVHPRKLVDADPSFDDQNASMGPRMFIRGNATVAIGATAGGNASMGPRMFIRGNPPPPPLCGRPTPLLQWGRGCSSAETNLPITTTGC